MHQKKPLQQLYGSLYVAVLLLCSCGSPSVNTTKEPQPADTPAAVSVQQKAPEKNDVTAIYVQAIGDYIKQVYKNGKPLPDTIFIGRHAEFPAITLPATIGGASIAVITSEEGQAKLAYRPKLVYLNVMSWIDKEMAEMLIVTFNEFRPQHNLSLFYKLGTGTLVLDSLAFDYPYSKAQKHEGDFQH